jgi:hypothetical protein
MGALMSALRRVFRKYIRREEHVDFQSLICNNTTTFTPTLVPHPYSQTASLLPMLQVPIDSGHPLIQYDLHIHRVGRAAL